MDNSSVTVPIRLTRPCVSVICSHTRKQLGPFRLTYIPNDPTLCMRVFARRDSVKPPLQSAYSGPFCIIHGSDGVG